VSSLLKKDKGFTLIEIVLVLAIAGLLLVIIFIALNGAQKSRRDTARKNDAARALAALENCASNGGNNGSYTAPINCTNTLISAGYFTGNDPAGGAYALGSGTTVGTFKISVPGACTGTASISMYQEQTPTTPYCVHN
jgi:prepilin-type N-terminal cleavage/methylation domain-containing protein